MSNLPATDPGVYAQAKLLVASGLLPAAINTPEKAIVIKLYSDVLGIEWIVGMQTINVIGGRPTISPQLMIALARRSKEMTDLQIEVTDTRATCTVTRVNESPHTEIFTLDDAKKLQLVGKDNWIKQPRTMLKWRAVAAAFRVVFPDIIAGFYTEEEIEGAPKATRTRTRAKTAELALEAETGATAQTTAQTRYMAWLETAQRITGLEPEDIIKLLAVKRPSAYGDWNDLETIARADIAISNYMNAQAAKE